MTMRCRPGEAVQNKQNVPKKPKWQKGLEAARAVGKNKPFMGNATKLSPSEQKAFKECDSEECPVCGRKIVFNCFMTRSDYTYKVVKFVKGKKSKTLYACGYNHYRQLGGG